MIVNENMIRRKSAFRLLTFTVPSVPLGLFINKFNKNDNFDINYEILDSAIGYLQGSILSANHDFFLTQQRGNNIFYFYENEGKWN